MQEFRALDEQRKMTGLTPEAEQRWQELGMALGVDLSASMQPQGYYGADGLWYAYPPGYDPNAAWQQQQQPQQQWDPNQQYAQQPYAQQGYEQQAAPQPFYDQNTGVWYHWDPTNQAWYDPNTGTWYPQQQQQQWAEPVQQQPAPQTWAAPQPSAPQWGQPAAAPSWNAPAPAAPAWSAPAAPSAFTPSSFAAEPAPAPSWNAPAAPSAFTPSSFAAEPAPAPKPSVPRAPVFVPPTFTIKPKPSVPAPPPPAAAPPPKPAPAPVVEAAAEEPLEIDHDEVMEIDDGEVEELPVAEPPMVTTGLSGLSSNTSITKLDEATAQMLAEDPEPQRSALDEISTELAPAASAPASSDEFFPSVDALTSHAPVAESFATPIASTFEPVAETSESVSIETTPLEPVVESPHGAIPHSSPTQPALDLTDVSVDEPVHETSDLLPNVEAPAPVEMPSLDVVEEPLPSIGLSAELSPPAEPSLALAEEPAPAPVSSPSALDFVEEPAPLVEEPAAAFSSPSSIDVVEAPAPLSSPSSLDVVEELPAFEEPSVSVSADLMNDVPATAPVEAPLTAHVVAEVAPSPVMVDEPSISVAADLMDEVAPPMASSVSTHVVAPTPMVVDEPSISVSADLMAEGEEAAAPARTDITQELPPVVLPPELGEPEPSRPAVAPEVRLMPEPVSEPPALGDDDIPPTQPKLARVLPDGSTEVPLLQIRLAPPALSPPVAPMPATAPPPPPMPMPMSLSQPELVPMPPPSASASADLIVGEEPMLDATVEPMLEATVEPMIEAEVSVEPMLEATVEPMIEAEVSDEPAWSAAPAAAPELVPVPAWSDVPSPPPMAAPPAAVEAPSWDDVPEPPPMAAAPAAVEAPSWDDVPEPPPMPTQAPVSSPSGSSFDLLAMAPEAAPRIPIESAPAAPLFANSWDNAEPEPEVKADPSLFGSSFTAPPDEFAGGADDKVELASNFDFVAPSTPSAEPGDDVSIDTDEGEFVVESASAAELATNVRAGNAAPPPEEKLELANNFDFLDNSQLTGTGESWSDDRSSIALEGEEDEGEVIQGTVLEEDPPVEHADSWGTAVSQPSPVPARPPQPPASIHVPPLAAAPIAKPPAPVAAPPRLVAPAPPAVAPPAAGAVVPVPGEHRIILHTVEGQVKRGAIVDAKLGEPQVHLQLASGGNEVLPRERVKALFFMLAPGARPPATAGSKVRVTFKDGRQVAGFSVDHQSQAAGFFVVPADNRTNTERIFIFRHAVQSVAIDS